MEEFISFTFKKSGGGQSQRGVGLHGIRDSGSYCVAQPCMTSVDYIISKVDAGGKNNHKERHMTLKTLPRSLTSYWPGLSHRATPGSRNAGKCSLYTRHPYS